MVWCLPNLVVIYQVSVLLLWKKTITKGNVSKCSYTTLLYINSACMYVCERERMFQERENFMFLFCGCYFKCDISCLLHNVYERERHEEYSRLGHCQNQHSVLLVLKHGDAESDFVLLGPSFIFIVFL